MRTLRQTKRDALIIALGIAIVGIIIGILIPYPPLRSSSEPTYEQMKNHYIDIIEQQRSMIALLHHSVCIWEYRADNKVEPSQYSAEAFTWCVNKANEIAMEGVNEQL